MANIHTRPDFVPEKFLDTVHRSYSEFNEYQRITFDRNILKYIGRHWLQLSKSTRNWQSASRYFQKIDKRYPMPVTNYVFDKVFTVKSNLLKMFPIPYARPRVRSQKAERAAQFLDTAIKYFHDCKSLRYKRKQNSTAGWCLNTGGCIWIPYWNLDTGKFIYDYETEVINNPFEYQAKTCMNCTAQNIPQQAAQCPKCQSTNLSLEDYTDNRPEEKYVLDSKGEKKVKEKIPIGDPGLEVVPYYEWTFDMRQDELDECPWIIRDRVVSTDWVKDIYNKKVEPTSQIPERLKYKQRINSWVSGNIWYDFNDTSYYANSLQDSCVISDLWVKPGRISDDGKHYVIINDKVIDQEKFIDQGKIWADGKYPFEHYRFAKVDGKMFGKSMVDDIAQINDIINRIDQALEWNRFQLDPVLVNYVGSGATSEQLTGRLGRSITINEKGKEPVWISPPPYPQHVYEERNRRIEDINRLSVSDPFGGKIESRIPVGALNMALEQSSSKLTEFYSNMLDGSVNYWDSVRAMLKENLTTQRAFSIMGDDEDNYQSYSFIGSDLEGDDSYDDGGVIIKISHDDIYPQSRSALKQLVIEGMKSGSFNPQDPFSQAVVNKILGLDREGINKPFNVNVTKAQRKIMLMKEGMDITDFNMRTYGQPLNPAEFQGIPIQLQELSNFMMGQEFENMPLQKQGIFIKHFTALQQIQQQQQQQALEQQAFKAMAAKGSNVKME